jgi:hypothetical protein
MTTIQLSNVGFTYLTVRALEVITVKSAVMSTCPYAPAKLISLLITQVRSSIELCSIHKIKVQTFVKFLKCWYKIL